LSFFAAWLSTAPAVLSQVSKEQLQDRRDDAVHLAKEARQLSHQAISLTRLTKRAISAQSGNASRRSLIAETARSAESAKKNKNFDLEVRESVDRTNHDHPRRVVAKESQSVLKNYDQILAQYRTALSAYLQHRKEVQEHAAAFHAEAQKSKAAPPPVIVAIPEIKGLAVKTQDACFALQESELGLHGAELELFQAVQILMSDRKNMSGEQYATFWSSAQQKANALQGGANSFDQGVMAKQETIQGDMHEKVQQAMRDGDYRESQKVYGDHERTSMLLHEEVKRATMHSALAAQFLRELQPLSPYAGSAQSGGNASENIANQDPNQFAEDDKSLAAEFEHVQALYSELQDATPKFH
jgi:hypothetical protein